MSTDKARPIQERIAALFGRTSYFDPRDGAGGTSPSSIKNSDVAAALGFVAKERGRVAALVLETKYGSTLMHERELAKAWEKQAAVPMRNQHEVVLCRFAGALAIRQLAGTTYTSTMYAEYAYLLYSRREALQRRVGEAASWLNGLHDDALGEFRRVMREHATDRERRRTAA